MKDTERKFVGLDRAAHPYKRGELLKIWTSELDAAMAKARAEVREWFDVNMWGKKP